MKEEGGTWRHELKFVCTAQQLALLRERIRPLMRPDPHAGADGKYTIRSVYFDDEWDTGAKENEDGTDPREKFRIRIYNGSDEKITLELKQKMRGMTRKISCPLTRQQCEDAIAGRIPPAKNIGAATPAESASALPSPESVGPTSPTGSTGPTPAESSAVYQKFLIQQKTRRLRPKVIVEYDRTPWIYQLGNVRVTFDENIRSSGQVERFLEQDFARRPIMPTGWHVLEVKYDDFLPDYIRQVLQINTLRRTAFSKYFLCRTYET